jgi:hypothetical protein
VLDEVQGRVAQFGRVVRRDRGRHADGDALRAVGEQVREGGRKDDRLVDRAVVVGAEVDRVLVDAFEQEARDIGHARLGVAVGGGAVAVDVAKIALTVDERIARGEVLGEAHKGVVDGLVAVRMEGTHYVADHLGRLLERRRGAEAQKVHAVEDAPVHGFQAIARVRQRPVHDRRERIGEIALFQRLLQVDALELLAGRRLVLLAHNQKPPARIVCAFSGTYQKRT